PNPDPRAPFLLDFVGYRIPTLGQLRLEDGKTTNLYETMEWTRIRSDVPGLITPRPAPVDEDVTGFVPPVFEKDALAVQVVWRFYDRSPNEVIGLYSCRVASNDLHELQRAIEDIYWARLPRPTSSHFTDPFVLFRYARGDLFVEREFSVDSHDFIEAIEPVWEGLATVERKLEPLATLAIHAKVEPMFDDSPQYNFH